VNRFLLHTCLLLASVFPVTYIVTASDSLDSWESAESVGDGWYNLPWLGHYYSTSDNWVYHVYHGWLYRPASDMSSIWLHDQELGWVWTKESVYPFLYQYSTQGWLYYLSRSSNPRSFYDFEVGQWVSVTMTEIPNQEEGNTDLKDGLYAKIETSLGNIVLGLEFEKCPITVCNFVSLAEGTMNTERQGPYYDGLIFHRVIKGFMIQGGDPLGTGGGGPGYSFRDEIDFSLLHTGKGILSMANAGPSTNGSQFFITHAATSWLDGKHTVFGQVVEGMDVLDAIAGVAVDSSDKPTEPVTMNKASIIRVGEKANAFETGQAAFDAYLQARHPNETAGENHLVETRAKDGYNVTASGLVYKAIKEGTGNQPSAGSLVTVDYEARLVDGTVFDSSYIRGTPTSLYLNRVMAGFGEGVQLMKTGGTMELHIPHNLAYGESNVGLVIPPFSTIIFTVELISFQ
jgi:peptidyl-prolyl cis-trans isomerase A (cyclophilin A)